MIKLILMLTAATVLLTGCAESPTGKAYVQCVRDYPNTDAQNALLAFGAIGGAISGLTQADASSPRRQCFIDHGVPL